MQKILIVRARLYPGRIIAAECIYAAAQSLFAPGKPSSNYRFSSKTLYESPELGFAVTLLYPT
jgi:hypothetical protein